ncbi:hypothetical protein SprV_0702409600 [Sparganum proliferum]
MDAWMARKIEEIQGYVNRNEAKNFCTAIKAIYGRGSKGIEPLLSSDGSTLLAENSQILNIWTNHTRIVLNRRRHRPAAPSGNHRRPGSPALPLRNHSCCAQPSSGNARGFDVILAEIYKHSGHRPRDKLTTLFQGTWRCEHVSQDFSDATIVHLYKREGNRQFCDNHRDIWLLNIAGKIFTRIILNLLNGCLEQGLLS